MRSKSVQVLKKASVYAAFHCCRGVQVCPVLVRFPLFLYTCTTMKTPVFMRVCAIVVHFLIPSPGVRDRTGQAAFLRSARAGPSAKAGWRQVKVLPAFSKAAGCRAEPYGLPGVRGRSHRLPLLPKRGDGCPPLGVPQSPGLCLRKGRAGCLRGRSSGYRLRSRLPARSAQGAPHWGAAPYAPLALLFSMRCALFKVAAF